MTDSSVIRTGPIRYATAGRFGRPQPVDPEDPTPSSGEVPPQLPSRLGAVIGEPLDDHPQGEDCLNLSITTPARDDAARPVLVWLHGGAFVSGAGLLDWYDGGALVAEGDVVVVSVNYRLGALGYLCLDGVSEGNLGLHDQLEALRWVKAHIAGYGGDPDNVTVVGQSAGGISIRLLMRTPSARGLFRRAILQSAPLTFATRPYADSLAVGRIFADLLGADPRTAEVSAVLAAQRQTAMANLRRSGSAMEPPFLPVEGIDPIATPGVVFDDQVRDMDVLYGWNADDMTAFAGEDGDPSELTRQYYQEPLGRFGARLTSAGARVRSYRLDWRPTGSPLGATHCVELPLLLGDQDAWRASPMLGNASWREVESIGTAMRAAWISFARTGVTGPTPAPLRCGPGVEGWRQGSDDDGAALSAPGTAH